MVRSRWAATVVALLCASVWTANGAGAAAEPVPDDTSSTAAAYYADRLAEQPEGAAVHVGDDLVGMYDTAVLEEDLHTAFGTLGVPYYVVAAEWPSTGGGTGQLAPIADRVGRDGLYVLLEPGGTFDAFARGTDLGQVEDAQHEALMSVPTGERRIGAVAAALVRELGGGLDTSAAVREERPWNGLPWDLSDEYGAEDFGFAAGGAAGVLLVAGVAVLWGRGRSRTLRWAAAAVLPAAALGAGAVLVAVVDRDAGAYDTALAEAAGADRSYYGEQDLGMSEEPPYVRDTARVERFADGLADDTVHVDPALRSRLSAAEEKGLAEDAEAAGVPVRIAVVAGNPADESLGNPDLFLHALHAVLQEDAVYIAIDPTGGSMRVAAVPFGTATDDWALSDSLYEDEIGEAGQVADVARAAMAAAEAAGTDGGSVPSPSEPILPTDAEPEAEGPPIGAYLGSGAVPGLLASVPAAALLAAAGYLAVRRLRGRTGIRSGAPAPDAPLGDAHAPSRPTREALDRMLDHEIAALRTAVEDAGEDHRRHPAAMSVLDAVLLLCAEEHDGHDSVGMIVMCRRARAGIIGDPAARLPVCTVNPLHGAATGSGAAKPAGARCAACAAADKRNRPRERLTVGGGGSAEFWKSTGYGAAGTDPADAIRERLGVR